MNQHDLSSATWTKSSYSGANGGDCVEVAVGFSGGVPVRDSKEPDGPAVVFSTAAWGKFVGAAQSGGLTN